MTYRGIVSNGVVVLDGDKPAEGTVVEITPVAEETKVVRRKARGFKRQRGESSRHWDLERSKGLARGLG